MEKYGYTCDFLGYPEGVVSDLKTVFELIDQNKQRFLGRLAELELMNHILLENESKWCLLHYYGPSGMGKSSLLRAFEQSRHLIPCFYINGNRTFEKKEQFLNKLYDELARNGFPADDADETSLSDMLNQLAKAHSRVVLLFDGLDEWAPIEVWLRDHWLASLSLNVRVCSTGRCQLDSWQMAAGWGGIVRNESLGPLPKSEWMQVAADYGIADHRILNRIGQITEGVPLAVKLACYLIIQNDAQYYQSERGRRLLVDKLAAILLHGESLQETDRNLLELASIVNMFDKELLESMVGEPLSDADFHRFCRSSFVSVHSERGWTIRRGVRNWVRAGLRERNPEAYRLCKKRAEAVLHRRISDLAADERFLPVDLAIGKLFLNDNDFIHYIIYPGSDNDHSFETRQAEAEDLPRLASIYENMIAADFPNVSEDTRQQDYLYDLWEADRSTILIVLRNGSIAGFLTPVAINERTRKILLNNPVTRTFIDGTKPESNDYLYWIHGSDPPVDPELYGFTTQNYFFHKLKGNRITGITWNDEVSEAMKLAGFRDLPWAAYRSPSGIGFSFLQLDSRLPEPVAATAPILLTEDIKWTDLAKKALVHYPNLERQPDILQMVKQKWNSDISSQEIASRLRNIIEQHLIDLQNGRKAESIQAKILQYAFMKKCESHEAVAELLGLPPSTYYRNLKKLVDHLASALRSEACAVSSGKE